MYVGLAVFIFVRILAMVFKESLKDSKIYIDFEKGGF